MQFLKFYSLYFVLRTLNIYYTIEYFRFDLMQSLALLSPHLQTFRLMTQRSGPGRGFERRAKSEIEAFLDSNEDFTIRLCFKSLSHIRIY